jgi:hypothetical protein
MAQYLYEPLKEDEQEVLQRMIEGQDVYVEVEGWGYHPHPTLTAGDKRLQVRFPMEFTKPKNIAVPLTEMVLILRHRDGREIFRDRKSTLMNGQAPLVSAGLCLDLIWDIALAKISPEFQRLIMPGVRGEQVMSIQNGKIVR